MPRPTHQTEPVPADEEYAMPCAEALLASALALMTGYVQGCCDDHRTEMAQKVVQHLLHLSEHPLLTPDFKTLLWNLHTRWLQHTHPARTPATQAHTPLPTATPLWHKTPETVQ
jgi:hypothetical protein